MRDSAISSFSNGLFLVDPMNSLELDHGDNRNADLRNDQLVVLGNAWMNYDPDTAQSWVQSNSLPADARANFGRTVCRAQWRG